MNDKQKDGYSLISKCSKPAKDPCLVISTQVATAWSTCGWSQVFSLFGEELQRAGLLAGFSFYCSATRGAILILSLWIFDVYCNIIRCSEFLHMRLLLCNHYASFSQHCKHLMSLYASFTFLLIVENPLRWERLRHMI